MAIANAELIKGIRDTGDRLTNNPDDYRWHTTAKCQCGQLALSLGVEVNVSHTSWEHLSKESFCHITERPTTELFQLLYSKGLEYKDFDNLEELKDPEVLASLNVEFLNCSFRYHVIKYLYAWADLLENRMSEDSKNIKEDSNSLECFTLAMV